VADSVGLFDSDISRWVAASSNRRYRDGGRPTRCVKSVTDHALYTEARRQRCGVGWDYHCRHRPHSTGAGNLSAELTRNGIDKKRVVRGTAKLATRAISRYCHVAKWTARFQ